MSSSMSLREARRWLTRRAMLTAEAVAPCLAPGAIDAIQWSLAKLGPRMPILGSLVAQNMRAAGVFTPIVLKDYFEQVSLHLSNAIRIFKLVSRPAEVADLARRYVEVDDSISLLRQAIAPGKGAVVAPAHVCNYLLTLARLHQEVPVCVYLRWSGDQRRREMKQAWCRATGLPVILEPESEADPASRAAKCVEALRRGEVLVMTPDIAQKTGKGVPVRLLGRSANLPTGPASIAMLAESPLVPVFGRLEGGRHVVQVHAPIEVRSLPRADGGRKAALQKAMQVWADRFEEFLRRAPEAWFLWGDSRWSRVLAGDEEYAGGFVGENG
jgi:lauroyl/myristoyl acyltransferase